MPRCEDAGCVQRKDIRKCNNFNFRTESSGTVTMKKWPDRPKGLTERGYRKYMAKQKEVVVNGNKFMLQSVSPRWYFDLNDRCGMTGGKRKTAEYIDELFKNVVIDPKEVSTKGFDYFEEAEDILTPEKLLGEIESFLRGRS